jgi:hypothetical protein
MALHLILRFLSGAGEFFKFYGGFLRRFAPLG